MRDLEEIRDAIDDPIETAVVDQGLVWLERGGLATATFTLAVFDALVSGDFTTICKALAATFASDGRTPTDCRISLAEDRVA